MYDHRFNLDPETIDSLVASDNYFGRWFAVYVAKGHKRLSNGLTSTSSYRLRCNTVGDRFSELLLLSSLYDSGLDFQMWLRAQCSAATTGFSNFRDKARIDGTPRSRLGGLTLLHRRSVFVPPGGASFVVAAGMRCGVRELTGHRNW